MNYLLFKADFCRAIVITKAVPNKCFNNTECKLIVMLVSSVVCNEVSKKYISKVLLRIEYSLKSF